MFGVTAEHLCGQVFLESRQIDVGTVNALVFLGPVEEGFN